MAVRSRWFAGACYRSGTVFWKTGTAIRVLVIRMLDCLCGLVLVVLQARALRGGAVEWGQKESMWLEQRKVSL